jgi:hypothetical protein
MTPLPSRWPAGTLAAAGTTPARTIEVSPTLVISQGHHPAKHRSAIPTRAYESGSGHGHDAAPAGHPHPPRPPQPARCPHGPALIAQLPAPACQPQGRLRRRRASAPRPLTPATRRTAGRLSRARTQIRTPSNAHPATRQKPRNRQQPPLGSCKALTDPLHMSALLNCSGMRLDRRGGRRAQGQLR